MEREVLRFEHDAFIREVRKRLGPDPVPMTVIIGASIADSLQRIAVAHETIARLAKEIADEAK